MAESGTGAEKPDWIQEETLQSALVFLDELREDGVTNMYGAGPYLQEWWSNEVDGVELDRRRTREVVAYWMKTFSERHKKE